MKENPTLEVMTNLLKDLYSMAYQFAWRMGPKRGSDNAADYAKWICILSLALIPLFILAFVDVVIRIPVHNLFGRGRLGEIVFTLIALFVGNVIVGIWLRRIPELQAPETIERHYDQLPAGRKILVPCLAGGPLVGILLLIAARQFLGWFGGI